MTPQEINRRRLANQRLSRPSFDRPEDAVGWLGAVQSQDYFGAKWGLALRMKSATDGALDDAFNAGRILRTHVLRPTWHFVAPADIRWLLSLTAPRVHAVNGHMSRKLGLSAADLTKSHRVISKELRGGGHLTRNELREALTGGGVDAGDNLRATYLMMHAELEQLICSGPRRGKQFTYALLDERVPAVQAISRDEALAELARRYFLSRGPASVQDFTRWSGLTLADARAGVEAVSSVLDRAELNGATLWFPPGTAASLPKTPAALLLSIYDEFISGYRDRSAMAGAVEAEKLLALGNALTHVLIVDGRIAGTWKRTIGKKAITIDVQPYIELKKPVARAIDAAAEQYGRFHAAQVELAVREPA